MVNPRRVPWTNERELRDLYGMIWDDFSNVDARAQAVARVHLARPVEMFSSVTDASYCSSFSFPSTYLPPRPP